MLVLRTHTPNQDANPISSLQDTVPVINTIVVLLSVLSHVTLLLILILILIARAPSPRVGIKYYIKY